METLPEDAIQDLWHHFNKYHDTESRNILLEHYLYLVKYTAERLYPRFPSNIELDDMCSVGVLGLIDAICKFDPDRKVRFETYAVSRIRGAIIDDIRKKDWVPRLVRTRAQTLAKVSQRLEALFGRIPTEQELAEELEMGMAEFYHFQRDANAASLISLHTSFSDAEGESEFSMFDVIFNPKSQDPFLEVHRQDFIEHVKKGFSKQEQLIIVLYHFEEMTMKEIGLTLGISESRVCQLHSSILTRLKEQLKLKSHCPT